MATICGEIACPIEATDTSTYAVTKSKPLTFRSSRSLITRSDDGYYSRGAMMATILRRDGYFLRRNTLPVIDVYLWLGVFFCHAWRSSLLLIPCVFILH